MPSNFALSDDSLYKLAAIMYDSVSRVPAPQVAVTDINEETERTQSVQVAAGI